MQHAHVIRTTFLQQNPVCVCVCLCVQSLRCYRILYDQIISECINMYRYIYIYIYIYIYLYVFVFDMMRVVCVRRELNPY